MAAESVWDELCDAGAHRHFNAGDLLLRHGAKDRPVLVITHGFCKVVTTTTHGREVLVTVRGRGDIVGELAALTGRRRATSVVALTPMDVRSISRSEFDGWLETSDSSRRLATLLAEELLTTANRGIDAQRRVEIRLADRILYLAERFGPHHLDTSERLVTSLTHQDFAAWIGATRSVTTRAMGALSERGLVAFGRGWIQILDPGGLDRLRLEDT